MIKVISTNAEGLVKESHEGVFMNTGIANVRDFLMTSFTTPMVKAPVIRLHPGKKRQQVLGFGGAFTDAACYMISRLDKSAKRALMEELFSPSGLNFNVGRLTVATCDFARTVYSYCDTPGDVEMKHFSIDYDRDYIIPAIKTAREINPDLFLLSSCWSPPGWMKTGGMMTGGFMHSTSLKPFARYYTRYLEEYAKAGVKINALTSQNETETDQQSTFPACYWSPELEINFIRDNLMPMLKEKGLSDIEIWIMDHNFNMWNRARWTLDDPTMKPLVKAIAWHPYGGSEEAMDRVHQLHPDIDAHLTEMGGGWHITETSIQNETKRIIDPMNNWCRSIMAWNIALNEFAQPHIGPAAFEGPNEGGLVQIHSETGEVKPGCQLKALTHFSKYVKRGATCIQSECSMANISQAAFRNPNGEYVVVVANPGGFTAASIQVEERYAQVRLMANTVNTLIFK
jgi:glucosylceramidase